MRGKQSGFSFVEIVVAIVIMSIIAMGLVTFITDSSEGYFLSATRNQVSSSGRVVIDRIAMELHNALPESVRITDPLDATDQSNGLGTKGDQCIEFIPVRAATTYIDPAFRPAAHKTTFNVVEFMPEQDNVSGVYVVIYPTSHLDLYGASFSGNTTEAIAGASVADADDMDGIGGTPGADGINEITTTTNHRFKRSSSVERLFLTEQPVSFCVSGSKLFRYSGYGFSANQLKPVKPNGACAAASCLPASTPQRELVTDLVDNSALTGGGAGQAFDQLAASRRRNAVIQIELNFSLNGQEVRLNHEVLQQAAP